MSNFIKIFSTNNSPFPWYLFLLPHFFVFHGYVEYYGIVYLEDAALLGLQYLLAVMGVWILMVFAFKNKYKAALYTLILFVFIFFFGAVHDAAKSAFNNSFITSYSIILPISILFFILLYYRIKKMPGSFGKLEVYLTTLFILLILIDLVNLVSKANSNSQNQSNHGFSINVCDTCTKPDIYLIVADEYAGHRQLKDVMNFDNSLFENELKTRGFHVNENSMSNYNSTPYSIASMLNMQYLEGVVGDHDNKSDIKHCYDKISKSEIGIILQHFGYVMINNSVFNFSDQPTDANITLFPIKARLISGQTFPNRFWRDLGPTLIVKFDLKRILEHWIFTDLRYNEKTIQRLKTEVSRKKNSPRFVYTHLMMPHEPFYYDENHKLYYPDRVIKDRSDTVKHYIGYLQYSNDRFLKLIDHVKKKTSNKAIILFMSDHGFKSFNTDKSIYKFMNINAVFLPGHNYSQFYPGISNVNHFRVILNTVFNQKLPLLKDSVIHIK